MALEDARYFTATAFALQERPQFYDRDVEPANMVQLVASLRLELEAERLRRVRAERRLVTILGQLGRILNPAIRAALQDD